MPRSAKPASAQALLAVIMKSYRKGVSLKAAPTFSRRRLFILFLTTAFPIFLLTEMPSLLKGSPFGAAYIKRNLEENFRPVSITFLKSLFFLRESK